MITELQAENAQLRAELDVLRRSVARQDCIFVTALGPPAALLILSHTMLSSLVSDQCIPTLAEGSTVPGTPEAVAIACTLLAKRMRYARLRVLHGFSAALTEAGRVPYC